LSPFFFPWPSLVTLLLLVLLLPRKHPGNSSLRDQAKADGTRERERDSVRSRRRRKRREEEV
jgi:hypothetical protein